VTASNHRPSGSGDNRPASAAAPGSAPRARGRGSADAPGADSPRLFPAEALALVVGLALPHAPSRRHLAPSALRSCAGLARAWREPEASALEAVEKVVTGVPS